MSTPELSDSDLAIVRTVTDELLPAVKKEHPSLYVSDVIDQVRYEISRDESAQEYVLRTPPDTLRKIRLMFACQRGCQKN